MTTHPDIQQMYASVVGHANLGPAPTTTKCESVVVTRPGVTMSRRARVGSQTMAVVVKVDNGDWSPSLLADMARELVSEDSDGALRLVKYRSSQSVHWPIRDEEFSLTLYVEPATGLDMLAESVGDGDES